MSSFRHYRQPVATVTPPVQRFSTMARVAERGVSRQPQPSPRLYFTIYARASLRFGEEQALGRCRFIYRTAFIAACSTLSLAR